MPEPRFRRRLHDLGVRAGAVVIVHSSMDSIRRRLPEMSPIRVIEALLDLIGKTGTLLMPTYSFSGSEERHVQQCRDFDPRRSPSYVGLLTEFFRRMPNVLRSLHPTHSVAACGPLAEELLREHHLGTSFGENSPFCKMRKYDGIAVGLGVFPVHYTPFHVPEELHPLTRAYHYGTTTYPMTIHDGDRTLRCDVLPLRADRRRSYRRATRILIRERLLRHETHRGLTMGSIHIDAFIKRAFGIIDAGDYSIPREAQVDAPSHSPDAKTRRAEP